MAHICCDTSFLYSLYGRDSFTAQAVAEMRRLLQPIILTGINEFEWENSIRLAVFRKLISHGDASIMRKDFAEDIRIGKLIFATCNLASVLTEAKRLSAAHTLTGGHRSFDILHVAAARELGARDFFSFDANQRMLAQAEGLKLRPR